MTEAHVFVCYGALSFDAAARIIEGALDRATPTYVLAMFSADLSRLPERTVVNSVIQGTAADMIKLAMLAIRRRLRHEKLQANMLLQIHDELVFESPPEEIGRLGDLVRAEMRGALPLSVPLKVDVKTGDNWAACE